MKTREESLASCTGFLRDAVYEALSKNKADNKKPDSLMSLAKKLGIQYKALRDELQPYFCDHTYKYPYYFKYLEGGNPKTRSSLEKIVKALDDERLYQVFNMLIAYYKDSIIETDLVDYEKPHPFKYALSIRALFLINRIKDLVERLYNEENVQTLCVSGDMWFVDREAVYEDEVESTPIIRLGLHKPKIKYPVDSQFAKRQDKISSVLVGRTILRTQYNKVERTDPNRLSEGLATSKTKALSKLKDNLAKRILADNTESVDTRPRFRYTDDETIDVESENKFELQRRGARLRPEIQWSTQNRCRLGSVNPEGLLLPGNGPDARTDESEVRPQCSLNEEDS